MSVTITNADRVPAGILFGDMKGSTAAAADNDALIANRLVEYMSVVAARSRASGAEFFKVKFEGDGFMVRLPTAHLVVECGFELKRDFEQRGWTVRLGGHFGEPFELPGGDIIGNAVNRAARVGAHPDASFCQFLVSQAVDVLIQSPMEGVDFKEYGVIHPKGIPDGLLLYEVVPAGATSQRERQRAEYLTHLAETHQFIDLGGLAPQIGSELVEIPLDDIFVHLSAHREAPPVDPFEREEIRLRREMEEAGDLAPAETERRLRELAERFDARYGKEQQAPRERVGVETLAEKRLNVVLGDPGSGKTTLLRYVARRLALGRALDGTDTPLTGPWENLTPVYVRIGEFSRQCDSATLSDYASKPTGPYATAIPADLLDFEMQQGRCLFLLDGLDEITDAAARQRVRDSVRDFARANRNCRFVLTSRIVGYREAPLASGDDGFAHFTLCPFDDSDIECFLTKWYAAIALQGTIRDPQQQNARVLTDGIRKSESVRRFATNPLLLTLIALIYWREVKLPRRRIELYRDASVMLIEKWRPGFLRERECSTLLMTVAFHVHSTSGSGLISRSELERLLITLKTDPKRGGRSQMDAEQETAEFVRLIGLQSGLLSPRGFDDRGNEVYGFLHLTFEEYFAARELARRWKEETLNLKDYLHLPRWQEILLLASAHLSDGDDEQISDRFVRQILNADSPYEEVLHRDLLLAARCLGDDAYVYVDLQQNVFQRLDSTFVSSVAPLNDAISQALSSMAGAQCEFDCLGLLQKKLRHKIGYVRSAAAEAIGALGERSATPEVLSGLAGLLRDGDWQVRSAAARAIGALGERSATPEVLSGLAELLRDGEWRVRCAAAQSVGSLGVNAATPEIVTGLARWLRDTEWEARRKAAMLTIGPRQGHGNRAIEDLEEFQWWHLGQLVPIQALARLGKCAATPEVLSAWIEALRCSSSDVREVASSSIAGLREWAATPEFVSGLAGLLRDGASDVRSAAARAIGALGERSATPEVLQALAAAVNDPKNKETGAEDAAWSALNNLCAHYGASMPA